MRRCRAKEGLFAIIAVVALITACRAKAPGGVQKVSPIASWSVAEPGVPVLSDIVWSGSQFVAVGVHGSVVTSVDGSIWTPQNANVTGDLQRIAWSGSVFVAVAVDGTIISSLDGASWTTRDNPLPSGTSLESVTWASAFHRFIIVGNGNTPALLTSADGESWTSAELPSMPGAALSNIACSTTNCLAVGTPYGSPVVLASNDAITWSYLQLSSNVTSAPYAQGFYDIAWSGTQFVALGIVDVVPPPSYFATSMDGGNWNISGLGSSTPSFEPYINTVRAMESGVIASGAAGTVLTSPDGTTWDSHGSTPQLNLMGVAGSSTADAYAAVATSDPGTGTGYSVLLTTHDLSASPIAWTESLAGFNLAAVTWAGNTYVAVGNFGTVQTSVDGRLWTSPKSVTAYNLNGVASNGKVTVAVGAPPPTPAEFPGPFIISSRNNIDWNARVASIPNGVSLMDGGLHAVIWSGELFVAVGDAIFTSSDGNTWTWQAPGTGNRLYAVVSSKDKYVAVGEAGTLVLSPDAKTWTSAPSGATQNLTGIASSGALFVVVGASGTVLTSADALTWTTQISGTQADLQAITWTGAEFVVAGAGGTLLTSVDGTSWTGVPALTGRALMGLAAAPSGETACVGDNGTILAGTP